MVNGEPKTEQKKAYNFLGKKNGKFFKGSGGSIPNLPPQLDATPAFRHVYRFQNSSSTPSAVTVLDLFGAAGTIGTVTNSTVTAWTSSLKLKKVVVWPSIISSSAPVPTELTWGIGESGQVPDSAVIDSLPEGITSTKAMSFVPPQNSLASFWISEADSSAALFTITTSPGSIVDVHLSVRLSNVFPGSAVTVATAVVGTVYYLALDGPTTNRYVAIGVPTTH
jgi:hypothetical protein